jgi:hypothetical protein
VRAPATGRFRITAKRIGVKRFASDFFDLSAGETKRVDVELDAVSFTLPEVVVEAVSLCLSRPNQTQRVAALWEEARTALTASQISLRDRLFQGRVARYVRTLDPRTLRVLDESRSDLQGILDRPFTSLSGDSLSKIGYWRTLADGSTIYNAPDAAVLMSDAFLHDHCFWAVDGGRDRRGMEGIAFEPRPDRQLPDVRGTLWLDSRTFELRLVEFRYTRLQISGDSTRIGGEVHFTRLQSGAWIVRRWFIRMPQLGHYADAPVGVDPRMPSVLVRPGIYRLLEEGGDVTAQGMRFFEKPAVVTGVVLDSLGLPLLGSMVRLAGTPFVSSVDSDGRFRLDSLPAGVHTLIAEHPGYTAFGMYVDDQVVRLQEGESQQVTLHGASSADIAARLCDGKKQVARRATLRLTVLDTATAAPIGRAMVWLNWTRSTPSLSSTEAGTAGTKDGIQSMTDARGVVAFCDIPADLPLELALFRQSGEPARVAKLEKLGENQVAARIVMVRRPR